MRCHQADEIDLPGFLAEPDARRFVEFRNHYPRCAACAAEVRAMAQLEFDLHEPGKEPEPRHPDAASLARYVSSAGSFQTADRMAIGRHLDGCAECRAEVTALRSTSPSAPTAPGGSAAAAEPAAPLRRVTSRRSPLGLDRIAAVVRSRAEAIGVRTLVAAAVTIVAFPAAGYFVATRGLSGRALPAVSAAPVASAPAAIDGPVALAADGEVRVAPAAAAAGLELKLPVARFDVGEAEVRVRDVAGRRELRAWRSVESRVLGARSVEMPVPPTWLEPGRYEVELYTPGAGDPVRFALAIESPAPPPGAAPPPARP